jgi:hypothetical protein
LKFSKIIILFVLTVPFLFNAKGITTVLLDGFASSQSLLNDEESENEQLDSEDEEAKLFQGENSKYLIKGTLENGITNFCFQFTNYKKVHRDFVAPPPDLA